MSMPIPNTIYDIELCSGEQRIWRHLGSDTRAMIWWEDMESGLEFTEASLMYAWQIIGQHEKPPANSQSNDVDMASDNPA